MTNTRRRMKGVVTRTKAEKTVAIEVSRSTRHPVYGKVIHSRKRYLVHDEIGCRLGDEVLVVESRPISKRKRWVVEKILKRTTEAEATASAVEMADEPIIETAEEPAEAQEPEAAEAEAES